MVKFYALQLVKTYYNVVEKIYAKLYIFTGEMFKFFIVIQIYMFILYKANSEFSLIC